MSSSNKTLGMIGGSIRLDGPSWMNDPEYGSSDERIGVAFRGRSRTDRRTSKCRLLQDFAAS